MIIVTVNGMLIEECKEEVSFKGKCEEVSEIYALSQSEENELIEQGGVTTFNGTYIEVYKDKE